MDVNSVIDKASQAPASSSHAVASEARKERKPENADATPKKNPVEDAAVVELSQAVTTAQTAPANPGPPKVEAPSTTPTTNPEPEEEDKQEEEEEIRRLKERDREVRTHEQAHLAALGPYKKGGASFTMQTGPDGRQYAVEGSVPVDVSPASEPEETIRKAQTIRRAALAPAEPSGADRSVAAQAAQMEAKARGELAKERTEESKETGNLSVIA